MATTDDVINAIRNADAAGDSAAVRQLGAVLQQMQAATQRQARTEALKKSNPGEYDPESPEWQAKYGATSNMSTTDKVLAGAGKAFADTGRGVGQLLRKVMPDKAADAIGLPTQADIDEAKRLDAPLMKTTAGKVGNVGGSVAIALPTVFIPGVNTVAGSGLVGAGMGFMQPVASDESRLKNTVVGGALGAAAPVVARTVAAGVKGAKALVEPFTEGGRQAIAGRTLQRFGVEAGDLAGVTSNPTVTGARTTLAEQITRPEGAAGAARLQDAMRATDPEIAAKMAAREAENNTARVGMLREMAGEGGQREFYTAARSQAAKDLYDQAFSVGIDLSKMSAAERGEITKLMKMPAIKDAMKGAQEIAQNQGTNLGNKATGSIEGLHNMKLALDDQIANLSNGTVSQVNKAKAVEAARDRLVTFMERVSPGYGEARATYAAMSKPINQMDVAEQLFRKGTSATSDLGGTPRLMPNQFIGQLKNEEALVKGATGRDLGKLSQVLDPDQFAKVQALGMELDKAAAVGRAANGPGSATAQRLASQNVLRQVLGPTGLPQSWAESTLLNTAMRPVQFAYNGVAEPKIQAVLADLLMNPAKAQAALQAARTAPQRLSPELQAALPYLEQALKTSVPATALSSQR
ncbi:hypothetical protein [Bacteriophage sp.]|nr:hypothetical protein [Caudoviricetes sp.]UOF79989.1 hypothetical protein [Bacteriophage sp.]